MEKYKVGQSELHQYDFDELPLGYEWIVYDYEREPYEGGGYLVAKLGIELFVYNLGHCSCYGPLDKPFAQKLTVSDWLSPDIHNCGHLPASIANKVQELLKEPV